MYYEERFINGLLHSRLSPDGEWQHMTTEVAQVANILHEMTDEGRLKIFGYFCTSCGTVDLPCYCMRDE